MKYDPSIDNIPKPNLPHLKLEDLIQESHLIDDHGEAIVGDRTKAPQFVTDPSKKS